jgi:D-sedoheptulose 7-phosphate isomerase
MKQDFNKYLETYQNLLSIKSNLQNDINKIMQVFLDVKKKNNRVFFFGNGGSSAICSHIATDLVKNIKIKSFSLHDFDLVTCFSNDFGFQNWIQKAIDRYVIKKKDIVILISSSGKSQNMLKAAKFCKKNSIYLITLTGFNKNNPLKKLGNINLWVNSNLYNFVEVAHLQVLAYIVDMLSSAKNNR